MRTFIECVPCFMRQTIDTMKALDADEAAIEEVLREVMTLASRLDFGNPPPVMGREIHRLIRRVTGNDDPFRELKRRQNEFALELYPRMAQLVESAADPFEAAARMAITGNIIDVGAKTNLTEQECLRSIDQALHAPLSGDPAALLEAVRQAESILYLADNAGEIVFDRLLIERLPAEKVTLVVRGGPAINDALMEDAIAAGLTDIVTVIDNGLDAPGTILDEGSDEFRAAFGEADMVISKGQGNYETVSHASEKDVFYLLKAKCPVIARDIGCATGAMIMRRGGNSADAGG